MRIIDIIENKRDKKALTKEEIDFFINGVTKKEICNYQISALLMAIYLNGMNEEETSFLTSAMAHSGEIMDLSSLGNKTVDKHSTGGVGDKTTLVVAPIAAALGCTVAKMSGRGLGHTGGTVDKLESITGYNTTIPTKRFLELSKINGLCLIGHTGNLAPADKILYNLRDVTGTVENISLIASSIMSKKIASGTKNIVLDVKYGSGAFMKTPEDAIKLAELMVKTGKSNNRNTAALITNMNVPLGHAIGNSLEVSEAINVLKGSGPKDLTEVCINIASVMYSLCFKKELDFSREKVLEVLKNGKAFEKLCTCVKGQGGDVLLLTGEHIFNKATSSLPIYAEKNGYVSDMDTYEIGKSACISGAGRETLEDKIDFSAGIILNKKYSDKVSKGDLLATLYGEKEKIKEASKVLELAYKISENKPESIPLIYKIII